MSDRAMSGNNAPHVRFVEFPATGKSVKESKISSGYAKFVETVDSRESTYWLESFLCELNIISEDGDIRGLSQELVKVMLPAMQRFAETGKLWE